MSEGELKKRIFKLESYDVRDKYGNSIITVSLTDTFKILDEARKDFKDMPNSNNVQYYNPDGTFEGSLYYQDLEKWAEETNVKLEKWFGDMKP